MKRISMLFVGICLFTALPAQKVYKLDASNVMEVPEYGHFKMGNPGPKEKAIELNSRYMTIGEKPVLPVMGELHFSRVRKDLWEDRILKMKACGVNVIATYLFWNHHEEIEGQFDWENEKDLRSFIKLCQKHQLYVVPRLGPWSHGEARNGGTPDWILQKKYLKDRSNDIVYQNYVRRYFAQIAKQLEGLYYKDGGCIIGIQLENEYWYGKAGEPHIQWLKNLALENGIDVPMYTVTGWGDGSVPPFEVIPLWGGYADAPWVEHVGKEYQPGNFVFDSFRDNKNIGNDQIAHEGVYMTYEKYPYFTCEMGVGVQNTYHRRLCIAPLDGLGMIIAKLGSGSNLLGYYIFAGATQFTGKLWSTEEEQLKTGYWSRLPVKSYDFQAAIRESGELAESYKKVKKLHYFVNEFEKDLAPMVPVIPKWEENGLQVAVRSNNETGYMFGINYSRYFPKKEQKSVKFEVKLKDKTLRFPQKGIEMQDSTIFVWPLNITLDDMRLNYATAQLLGSVDNCYLFFQNGQVPVEFSLDKATVKSVEGAQAEIKEKTDSWIISGLKPGKECMLKVQLKSSKEMFIIVLTEKEADNCWLLEQNGKKQCYLSDEGLYSSLGEVYLFSTDKKATYAKLQTGAVPSFEQKEVAFRQSDVPISVQPKGILEEAKWLESANFSTIDAYQQRYRRFFFKEFNLDNPSEIKKVTLFMYPESKCTLNLNDTWVYQEVKPNQLNEIDLTGYVRKGVNILYAGFPFVEGKKLFAARVVVEYYNYDRIEFSTDASWLTTDYYSNPSLTREFPRPVAPVIADKPGYAGDISYEAFKEWSVEVPTDALENLHNIYMRIKYSGDKAELYNGYMLSDDDYNSHTTWTVGLNRQEHTVEGKKLNLVIYQLDKDEKIFFDLPANGSDGKVELYEFGFDYEYIQKID